MFRWYKNLYVGEQAKKRIRTYIRRISHGKPVKDIYLITIASNEKNQLDIINSYYLLQPVLKKMCPMIVGVACGSDEARNLVVTMIEDTLHATGNADVRSYLLEQNIK